MDTLALMAVYALVVFFVFMALRQLALWYWRVNEIADSVVYIAKHFHAIDEEAGRIVDGSIPARRVRSPQEIEAESKLNLFND